MAMKTGKVYLVGTHRYSFRAGTPAEVTGVAMVQPEVSGRVRGPRPCFRIQFEDGKEDLVPIRDDQNRVLSFYKLISEEDVKAGRIPEIIH